MPDYDTMTLYQKLAYWEQRAGANWDEAERLRRLLARASDDMDAEQLRETAQYYRRLLHVEPKAVTP